MIAHNQSNNRITCPRGDTGTITIALTNPSGGALETPITGTAVFAVTSAKAKMAYLTKTSVITDNTITIQLRNTDTRKIPAGTYQWDVRIVTDTEYATNSDATTDDVHSIFSATGMPSFIVTEVAVDV